MFSHKGRTYRINAEAPDKMLGIKGTIGLLGLEGSIVEQSCGHQDEAQGSAFNKLRGCGGNALLALNVDLSHPYASQAPTGSRARERMNGIEPFRGKKVCDGGSYAAGRADDKGPCRAFEAVQVGWV
jgi:hypothetical protein